MPAAAELIESEHDFWALRAPAEDATALADALQELRDAGFVEIGSTGGGVGRSVSLANGSHAVRLGFERHGDDAFVTYGVAKR
ncbi:hypothetical protein EV139_1602 [Leucobacter luti]|uniref:Uncharacterized protein n=1 Tax=Leucobacter luti TaxID=340320 RepID=A0A4Q7TYU6_9MICO|nr:hypothetical protein EV139_1602 [Leucobacter luti]